jgi:hypothetical protein
VIIIITAIYWLKNEYKDYSLGEDSYIEEDSKFYADRISKDEFERQKRDYT